MADDAAGNRLCLTGKDWRRITLIESGRLICCIFTGIKHVTVQEPSTPSETAGAAFSLYASVGDAAAMEPITDIGPFIARLEAPDARGLIVYDFPGLVIGQALRAGDAPDEAVEKWRTVTARHLDTLRKFRKKIVLVEAPRSPGDDEALQSKLQEHFSGRPLPKLIAKGDPDLEAGFERLAMLALGQDDDGMTFLHDLQARTFGPFSEINHPKIDIAESIYRFLSIWLAGSKNAAKLCQEQDRVQELDTALKAKSEELERAVAKKDGEIAELQSRHAKLQHEREKLQEEISELQKNATHQSNLKADLDKQLAEATRRDSENSTRIDLLMKEKTDAIVRAENLNKELKKLQDTESHQNKDVDLMRGQLSDLESYLTKISTEKAALCRELRELREENKKRTKDNDKLMHEQLSAKQTSAALHQKFEAAETEHQRQSTKLTELRREISEAEQNLADLTGVKDALGKQVAKVKEIHATKSQRLNTLTTEKDSADSDIAALQEQLNTAETERSEQGDTIRLLHGQVSELEEAMLTLYTKTEQARSESKAIKDQSDQVSKALSATKAEFMQIDGDRAWKGHIGAVFRQKARNLETALHSMERSHAKMANSLTAAEKHIEALSAENERLKSHIDDLYQSTSWRVMAPMRSIRQVLQK